MARHTYSSISACTSSWVLVERFNGFNPIQKPRFSLRKLSVGRKQQPLIETQLLIASSTTQRIRLNFNFAVYSFSLSSFSGCEIRDEMNVVHVKFHWIITVWKSQTELICWITLPYQYCFSVSSKKAYIAHNYEFSSSSAVILRVRLPYLQWNVY